MEMDEALDNDCGDGEVISLREERDRALQENQKLLIRVAEMTKYMDRADTGKRNAEVALIHLKNKEKRRHDPHALKASRKEYQKEHRLTIRLNVTQSQDLASKLRTCNELRALIKEEVDIETFEVRDIKAADDNPDKMETDSNSDDSVSDTPKGV